MIITNNNIIDIFKQWATLRAPFINDFAYGPLSDYGTTRQMKYPCMWVTDNPSSNITITNRTFTPEPSYIILFMDQINNQKNTEKDVSNNSNNVIHVMSDTQQLVYDFLNESILSFNKLGLIINENVSMEPFYDETTDKVCGWSLTFGLKVPYHNCIDATLKNLTKRD